MTVGIVETLHRRHGHDGGRFRRERAFFGVVMDRGRTRQIEGSSPDALRRDLTEVCASFNRGVARLDRLGIGLAEQTRVAAALYAGILRVHPFADGNHRTAFVALSAALWSLGLPAVEFADDKDMTGHDSAVAPALISPDGDRQAVREAARHSDRTREKPRDVRYPKTMENGSHPSNGKRDVAQIARGDRLVDATPESIRALADSAMLLSQGAHRAIEMKRKAGSASLDVPATTGAAQD